MDRFPILGAVTGILLTLLMEGTSERFVLVKVCHLLYTLFKSMGQQNTLWKLEKEVGETPLKV